MEKASKGKFTGIEKGGGKNGGILQGMLAESKLYWEIEKPLEEKLCGRLYILQIIGNRRKV